MPFCFSPALLPRKDQRVSHPDSLRRALLLQQLRFESLERNFTQRCCPRLARVRACVVCGTHCNEWWEGERPCLSYPHLPTITHTSRHVRTESLDTRRGGTTERPAKRSCAFERCGGSLPGMTSSSWCGGGDIMIHERKAIQPSCQAGGAGRVIWHGCRIQQRYFSLLLAALVSSRRFGGQSRCLVCWIERFRFSRACVPRAFAARPSDEANTNSGWRNRMHGYFVGLAFLCVLLAVSMRLDVPGCIVVVRAACSKHCICALGARCLHTARPSLRCTTNQTKHTSHVTVSSARYTIAHTFVRTVARDLRRPLRKADQQQ